MTTSGTVALTTVPVDELIDDAAKDCGFELGEVSVEVKDIAVRRLFTMLSKLANHGVTLWTQRKTLLGTVPNQITYNLPDGTVDTKNVLFRTVTLPASGTASASSGNPANCFQYSDVSLACTQTAPNGYIGYDFNTTVVIPTIGVMSNGAAVLDLVWESSTDNIEWTTFYAPGSQSYADLVVAWADIEMAPPQARYFRVREQGGATLDIRGVVFGQLPSELPMSRMNVDQYTTLPNKTQSASQTLQYFVQRLQNYPQMWVWPVAQTYYACLVAWNFRHIEDVGAMTNTIEVPQRWLLAVQTGLSYQLGKAYPKKLKEAGILLGTLETTYEKEVREAEDEERDDSPIFWGPNIGAYTA